MPATYQREFHPHGTAVAVTLLTSRCPACGAEATNTNQHNENLTRLKARKSQYGTLLLGEEILALRRRYGITQQQAAKIFGKGKIAFSRYENETSYPNDSTTNLLELAIQMPAVMKRLADKVGVDLPLWEARCEDERASKVRVISDVRDADTAAQLLALKELSSIGKRTWSLVDAFPFHAEHWKTKVVRGSANEDQFHSSEAAFA